MINKTDLFYQCVTIACGVLVIDQLTKFIANKFGLVSINTGISFGFFSTEHPVLGFALLVVLGILVVAVIQKNWQNHPISTGLFVGGALSNIADRIARGGVRDWLPLGFLPIHNNLADWAIGIAAILVIINLFRDEKKHRVQ
jgi:lipoprotein signal peptidase